REEARDFFVCVPVFGVCVLALACVPGATDAAGASPGSHDAATSATQVMPRVAADGMGGMYTVWLQQDASGRFAYILHLTGEGYPAPGWPLEGVLVSSNALPLDNICVVGDGAGGAFVAWDAGAPYGDVGLRHFSASGQAVDVKIQAPAQTLSTHAPASPQKFDSGNAYPALLADGSGGVFLAFQYSSELFDDRVYVERFTASGVLAPGWPAALKLNTSYYSVDPVITSDGSGGAYVA